MKFKKGQVYRDPSWTEDELDGYYVILRIEKDKVKLRWLINGPNYRGDRLIETYNIKILEDDILVSEKLTKIQRIIWEID